MARLARRRGRPAGPGPGPVPDGPAHRPGPRTADRHPGVGQHALREHHPAPSERAVVPGRRATSSGASGRSSAGTRRSWSSRPTSRRRHRRPPRPPSPRSAALYEVGFNRFFRGKDDGLAGDHVYIQGHAAPGIYARAFLEGRLDEERPGPLPPARSAAGRACRATRTPGSCPTSGSTRRCPWASGRSSPSTRPASTATCTTAASTTPPTAGCGASSATASATSPRRSGRSPSPARERLDNLTWVVNCNLQRLDGPVRGNGKIIQELEGDLPGRRVERHQGGLGQPMGRPARTRHRRRAAQPDEHHRRRRVPALRHRGRQRHPRALLRPRSPAAGHGRAPQRRRPPQAPPRRPRLPQALRRLPAPPPRPPACPPSSWPRR